MQLFGILLVLNRKSRLGRQHSRTSGASRVRRANGHWKNATVCCVQCPTIDGGEEAATIDEYAKRRKVCDFFQYTKPSSINHRLLTPPNLSIFHRAYNGHTRARRVTRITVECTAKCIWLQTDKQIQFDTHAVYTVHTKSFTELHSAQQGFWNSEVYFGWLTLV